MKIRIEVQKYNGTETVGSVHSCKMHNDLWFTDIILIIFFETGMFVSPNITNVITDSSLCRPCPRGADCELGGNSVVALPGFWIEGTGRRSTESKGKLHTVEVYACMPGKRAN